MLEPRKEAVGPMQTRTVEVPMKRTVPCNRLVVVRPSVADLQALSIESARQLLANNKVIEAACK